MLYDRKEGKRRRLASNTKLFTSATALHRLGAKGRLETVVRRRGSVKNGRLHGNLYLVGDGDPSFGDGGIRELARGVARSGIRRVKGDVIGDDTIFDRLRGVPDSNYGPSPYLAPLSGLVYNGSTYNEDPAKEAAQAFVKKLKKKGVKVKGKVRVGRTPKKVAGSNPIAAYSSPTIAALVEAMNHDSINFYAEMLLKRLAAESGKTGTTKRGVRAVENFVHNQRSDIKQRDGSGLTANNLSSPRDVVRLLVSMNRGKDAKPYFRSLAQPGKAGTLSDRMGGTPAAKRCRAKTGTITGVSTLSGYCNSGHGRVAFSLLMNGVSNLDAAHHIQDEMVVAIAKYRP